MMSSLKPFRVGVFSFLSFCMMFLSGFAVASQAIPSSVVPSPAPVSSGGIWQVFFGLAVVLGVIGGAAWIIKRMVPGQVGAGGALKMVGGMMVGPKERLVLIEVGETWLLLGVTANQVNTLHSMPKPAHSDIAIEPVNDNAFSFWLKRAMQRSKRDSIS